MQFDQQIQSTVPNGVAPFVVASQTLVTNLNANFLNGYGPGAFAEANHDHTSSQITDSTAAGRTLLLSPSASQQRADLGLMTRATTISAVASVNVSREEDPIGTPRPGIRFLEGSGVSISISNDDEGDRYDVTISATPAAHDHVIGDVVGLQDALDSKASISRSVSGALSVTGGGDLSVNRTLSLVNDEASPGNSKYYGTNPSGTKGYHSLPSGGGDYRHTDYTTTDYSWPVTGGIVIAVGVDIPSTSPTLTLPLAPANGTIFTAACTNEAGFTSSITIKTFAGASLDTLDAPGQTKTWVYSSATGSYHKIVDID